MDTKDKERKEKKKKKIYTRAPTKSFSHFVTSLRFQIRRYLSIERRKEKLGRTRRVLVMMVVMTMMGWSVSQSSQLTCTVKYKYFISLFRLTRASRFFQKLFVEDNERSCLL